MKKKKATKLYELQEACKKGLVSCRKCGGTRFPTVDHIVPVNILQQFALTQEDIYELLYNDSDNMEILCAYCNTEKGAKVDLRNPVTYMVLRRAIDKAETQWKSSGINKFSTPEEILEDGRRNYDPRKLKIAVESARKVAIAIEKRENGR